ncbi:putative signal peptide and transmembrane protein [Rhodopirellula islandica]|uniref:Signal peptide and transmembrane protein n=1 Tax=Rhodopirellula islandica TaxID=595434 RepID=A0A0J1B5I1_RHOIS|nr:hypothetical protein [Rhodopirellula islandica]KLU01863.1 putative signal peptide and transmembrane protein [Rhodopirellula islandica]
MHRFHVTHPRLVTIAVTLMALCVTAIAGTPLFGQDATETTDLELEVPIWIAELDADEAQTRRAAEQKLIDAGQEAADYLPAILDDLSIEARERLNRVRAEWATRKAETHVETQLIRLQNAKTLGEALEAISAASEVEFDLEAAGPGIDPGQSIQAPRSPLNFWHAVDHVLDQADLDINFYGGDRTTLMLIPRQANRPSRVESAAYVGIYRLEPTVVTARRVLRSPELSGLNLNLSIEWQPNRTPIGLSLPISAVNGKLSSGEALVPQTSGETIDIATNSEMAQSEFFLPMQLPSLPAEKIERLSGTLTAMIPGRRETFTLDLNDPAASQTEDQMTVAIESVRDADPLREIRVGVELQSAGRSLESHRQWIFENEAYVLLEDETRLDHLGYQVFRQTDSGVGIGYLFDFGAAGSPPPGSKLIYESPTSVAQDAVDFILNDIPTP